MVKADLRRGSKNWAPTKSCSGGEASLHPLFPEFIRYTGDRHDRVQTVTNGAQYADKDFYERCVQAGLGEITYSLHGDTRLHATADMGCFKLMKALIRSVRADARSPASMW